jgi:hypothetical protein
MTGPVRHGDPEAMRALASTWRVRAEDLGGLGGAVTTTLAATGFEGPAAARLARHADALRQEGLAVAGALLALAEEITRDAGVVERLNAEALRAADAEEEAAAAEARAQAAEDLAAAAPAPATQNATQEPAP